MRRCDPETADDVVADVFLIAWRRRAELPEEPLPWLLGTARHVLANHARGHSRRVRLLDRLAAEPAALAAPAHASGRESARVRAALARLNEKDRELLLLLALGGIVGSFSCWLGKTSSRGKPLRFSAFGPTRWRCGSTAPVVAYPLPCKRSKPRRAPSVHHSPTWRSPDERRRL